VAVARRLDRLTELRDLLSQTDPPDLGRVKDLKPLFDRLQVEGALLLPEELEAVGAFLGAVGSAASFLDQADPQGSGLARLRNVITPLPAVRKRLQQIVGPGHSVSSQASPALAGLRREANKSRERIRARLQDMMSRQDLAGVFSDQVITQRADRFVVPVKTDSKGRLQGIIHDTSGSGATCFVEPLDAVEDNNSLALLRRREQEEELRVLRETARQLASHLQVLRENQAALAKLDCLLAQAGLCNRLGAVRPELVTSGEIELSGARHPLLAWRALSGKGKAVPIHFMMDSEHRALVLSGANAGGKTVALKTVGLMTLMTMCGLHIPCKLGSKISIFKRVLCEMGDEQDLGRDLSTFTAHAGRLRWMLKRSGPGTLILVDELGGGTDPEEGSALGMAVLERFIEQGARALCTTHFHRLKAFAASAPGVENVSVAFDQNTRRPTYQLHYGAPGFSDALAVSRGLGFPEELIERAEGLLDQSERQTVAFLQQAQQAWQEASAQREAARSQLLAAEEKHQQARKLLNQARQERAGALADGKRRVRQVAQRLQQRLEGLLARVSGPRQAEEPLKPGQVRQEFFSIRRQAMAEVKEAVVPLEENQGSLPSSAPDLKKGDQVRVTSLGKPGVLLESPKAGEDTVAVSVGVRGVRVLVPLAEIEPVSQPAADAVPEPGGISIQAHAPDGLDLKLVGLTVDEALPLVDKALDQAILAGKPSIRLVHGIGTGRLGAAVRDYLRGHPYVAAARNEEVRRGGAGVTVVELRD
jgi:DNA mismatch repair protein MutS2